MDKVIVYSRPDGRVDIVVPAPQCRRIAAVVISDGQSRGRHEFRPPVPKSRAERVVAAAAARGLSAEIEWAESDEDFLARIVARSVPSDARDVEIVAAEAVPADRTFRGAWRRDTRPMPAPVTIDMAEARGIHRDRIRRARDRRLAALDLDYQRADEAGDAAEKRRVATLKQKLRDIPQSFDLGHAETPEALKQLWPDELPR